MATAFSSAAAASSTDKPLIFAPGNVLCSHFSSIFKSKISLSESCIDLPHDFVDEWFMPAAVDVDMDRYRVDDYRAILDGGTTAFTVMPSGFIGHCLSFRGTIPVPSLALGEC
jgi:hypothetical protein